MKIPDVKISHSVGMALNMPPQAETKVKVWKVRVTHLRESVRRNDVEDSALVLLHSGVRWLANHYTAK